MSGKVWVESDLKLTPCSSRGEQKIDVSENVPFHKNLRFSDKLPSILNMLEYYQFISKSKLNFLFVVVFPDEIAMRISSLQKNLLVGDRYRTRISRSLPFTDLVLLKIF